VFVAADASISIKPRLWFPDSEIGGTSSRLPCRDE
jgi:hypothetical protein